MQNPLAQALLDPADLTPACADGAGCLLGTAAIVGDLSAEPHLSAEACAAERREQEPLRLEHAPLGQSFAVHDVVYPHDGGDWPQRLEEIGFLPGERVMVTARGGLGGDPLAVRIGHSTFALRRAEAACVLIRHWPNLTS